MRQNAWGWVLAVAVVVALGFWWWQTTQPGTVSDDMPVAPHAAAQHAVGVSSSTGSGL